MRTRATFAKGTSTSMLLMRNIRASVLLQRKGLFWVVFSLGLFVAGDLIFGNPSDSPDGANHALAHLSKGVPILILAVAAYWRWRPRNPIMWVARVVFVTFALVIGAGQLEHSIGDPPHIVAKITPSQVAVLGLAILLAIATVARGWRSRIQQASS